MVSTSSEQTENLVNNSRKNGSVKIINNALKQGSPLIPP